MYDVLGSCRSLSPSSPWKHSLADHRNRLIAFDHPNLNRKETIGNVQMAQFALAYPRGTPPVPGLLVAPRTFLSVHCRTSLLAICSCDLSTASADGFEVADTPQEATGLRARGQLPLWKVTLEHPEQLSDNEFWHGFPLHDEADPSVCFRSERLSLCMS